MSVCDACELYSWAGLETIKQSTSKFGRKYYVRICARARARARVSVYVHVCVCVIGPGTCGVRARAGECECYLCVFVVFWGALRMRIRTCGRARVLVRG